jgi:peptidoglycan DL-endopeptidase CwlO
MTGHPDERHGADRGAVGLPVIIAIAAGALVLIPMLFGAGLLGTSDTTNTCGTAPAAQPGASRDAENGIPATYLRLYQQAGQRYGLPWNVLAAIGKAESDHGQASGPGVHSGANLAGAAGPMQIGIGGAAGNTWGGAPRHPATQKTGGIGVDGDGDGQVSVYDPADAIPAAARYLLAHGAPDHLQQAVFAYNHSTTYVHTVLAQAGRYATGHLQLLADTGELAGACTGDAAAFTAIPGPAAAKIIAYARAQLGKPYVFGGEGPDSFDCSGLTMMAYRAAGITIPRLANIQYHFGRHIPPGTEQPGDLVFFVGSDGTPANPGHVGIVTNPQTGMMIVAPHTGANVRLQSYKNYPGGPLGFTRPTPNGNCRVAGGNCTPPAPTDPGVTISRQRALVILSTRIRAPMPSGRIAEDAGW